MPYLVYAALSGLGGLAGCAGIRCPHKPSEKAKTYSANDLSSLHSSLIPYIPYLLAASAIANTYDLATTDRHIPKMWLHLNALGCVLALIGGSLRCLCYRALGRFFTFQLCVDDGQKIVKTGPYSLARHPAYTAAIVAILGYTFTFFGPLHSLVSSIPSTPLFQTDNASLAPLVSNITPLSLTQAALTVFAFLKWSAYRNFFTSRIPKEEEMLASEFGEEWENYKKTTPYKLIPHIW